MAHYGGRRSQGKRQRVTMRGRVSDGNGQQAFQDIEQKDDQSCFVAGRSMHISSADIAAAHGANVFAQTQAHEPVAEWKAANQVGQ